MAAADIHRKCIQLNGDLTSAAIPLQKSKNRIAKLKRMSTRPMKIFKGWLVQWRPRHCVAAAILLTCPDVGIKGASAQPIQPPAIVSVCAPCHGIDGTGGDVEKPNLAGQNSIYIREQLLAFRSGKRNHPEMKTISRDLTNREIDELVIYYSTLVPR